MNKRSSISFLLIAIMLMTSACSNAGQADIYIPEMSETTESESFNATTSVAIDDIPAYKEEISEDTTIEAEITTESIPESSEVISEDSEGNNNSPDVSGSEIKPSLPYAEEVRYLDTVSVSCEIISPAVTWIDQGLTLTSADSSSTLFGAGTELSEREVALNAYEAVGKSVGDTFTLWFRKKDGLHGYEYTIQEILNKDPDIVSYGDKVHTTYVRRWGFSSGMMGGVEDYQITGEDDLYISEKEAALGYFEDVFNWHGHKESLYNLTNLKVGDYFVIEHEGMEWDCIYRHTIQSINKVVNYGDAIKVSARYAYIPTEKIHSVRTSEKITLDFENNNNEGNVTFSDESLSQEVTRKFFEQVLGRKRGEYFICVEQTNKPIIYVFSILDILSGSDNRKAIDKEHVAYSASQEQVIYNYNSSHINSDDDALSYIFINDIYNKKIYCYNSYQVMLYDYDIKYDEKGRVLQFIENRDWGGYQNNYSYFPDGTWTKNILWSYPNSNSIEERKNVYLEIEYHDANGSLIKVEHFTNNNLTSVYEYEFGKVIRKKNYKSDGTMSETIEYDEWGVSPGYWEAAWAPDFEEIMEYINR